MAITITRTIEAPRPRPVPGRYLTLQNEVEP